MNVFEVVDGGRMMSRGSGLIEDVSRSGARVQVDRSLTLGAELVLRNRSLNTRVVVRNVHRTETGFGVGVEFLDGFEWTPDSDLVETSLAPASQHEPRRDPPRPATPANLPVPVVREERAAIPAARSKPAGAVHTLLAQIRQVHGRLWGRLGLRDDSTSADGLRQGASDPLTAFAFEHAPTKAVVLDDELNVVFANKRFTRTFGSERLLCDRSFRQFVDPEDLERIADCHRSARRQPDTVSEIEFVARAAGGRERTVVARWRYSAANSQSVVNLYDVTDYRREERELLSAFFGSDSPTPAIGIASWHWDVETRSVRCSREYAALYGLPASTARIDRSAWISLLHPDDRQRIDKTVDEMLSETGMICAEFRIVRPDGSVLWLSACGHLVCAPNGSPVSVVGQTLDITPRKQMEQQLAERSSELAVAQGTVSALMSLSSAGQILVGAAERAVLSMNEPARRLLGSLAETRPFLDGVIILNSDGTPVSEDRLPLVQGLRSGEAVRKEALTLRRHDRPDTEALISATPIRGSDGAVAAVLLTLTPR